MNPVPHLELIRRVVREVTARGGCQWLEDDAVQECAIEVMGIEEDMPTSYIAKACKYTTIDLARSAKYNNSYRHKFEHISIDTIKDDDDAALREGLICGGHDEAVCESALVESLMSELSDADRALIYMQFFLGYSCKQCADALGVTVKTIWNRKSRILAKWRKMLGVKEAKGKAGV